MDLQKGVANMENWPVNKSHCYNRLWIAILKQAEFITDRSFCKMGRGNDTSFWHENWAIERHCQHFPRLFWVGYSLHLQAHRITISEDPSMKMNSTIGLSIKFSQRFPFPPVKTNGCGLMIHLGTSL